MFDVDVAEGGVENEDVREHEPAQNGVTQRQVVNRLEVVSLARTNTTERSRRAAHGTRKRRCPTKGCAKFHPSK